MSLDAIELALDRMTDYTAFERLATELMYLEGWYDIKPLGGTADMGQDAVSERFFDQAASQRTVFQYTLQHYLPGKVKATIEKLRANNIAFFELIVVTPHSISSETQIKMRRAARSEHSIILNIFDRKTLISRLADLDNGIFHRHFPNIKAQVDDIVRSATRAAIPQRNLERTLLQVSLALTFRPGALRVRKSLFDHFVLAVLLDEEGPSVQLDVLARHCAEALPADVSLPAAQVQAAVARLVKSGLLLQTGQSVRASERAVLEVATSTLRLSEATDTFAADILATLNEARGQRVADADARRIVRNIRAALLEIARSRAATLGGTKPSDDEVPVIVRSHLDSDMGDLLVAALADALQAPTDSQAETIAHWTQAYLGLALMGLDPVLNDFQASRFSSKTFLLDTDIVLEAIVNDGTRSAGILDVLSSLAQRQCRLVVPDPVVDECVKHAARSEATYRFFGNGLIQLTPAAVEERVWNAFVKGYYYAVVNGRIAKSVTYREYLANFYEEKTPSQFFSAVITDVLPDEVEILPVDSGRHHPLADAEVDRLADALQQDLAERSKKARYRTEEEERVLARTDATLYLSALAMNPPDKTARQHVLGGTCYLLTETARYERVAQLVGIPTKVTVRPSTVAGILGFVGEAISPIEFVQLFDNPLLDRAVNAVWTDMEKLMRSGVDLRAKSLVRLRFDVDAAFHECLTAMERAQDAEEQDSKAEASSDERYMELIEAAARRGYTLIPEVAAIRDRIGSGVKRVEELQQQLDEAMSANTELEKGIAFFGKRRQKYLRRMGRQHTGPAR